MADYINTTTDLTDFYPQIESYQEKEIVRKEEFVSHSGSAYKAAGLGQVNMVFDAGIQLTTKTSAADVVSNAGSWYYDSDADVLYVHATDSDNLTSAEPPIYIGEDWDSLKEQMRDDACGFMDSVLSTKFSVPLEPRKVQWRNTDTYDSLIKRIAAALTCSFIIKRRNPSDPLGMKFYKEAWNVNPEVDEMPGLLNQILNGELALQNQITPGEIGKWSLIEVGSNTATRYPVLRGKYTGTQYKHYKIMVDTAGTPGTSTFKCSYDGGTTYDLTLQEMYDADNDEWRVGLTTGIYIEWPDQTYAEDDYWVFEMIPHTDEADVVKFGSIEMTR